MAAAQISVERSEELFGRPLKRLEDPKFITGLGTYVGDIRLANMLHAAFVRSPHAHAKIVRLDTRRALSSPGVRGILVGSDLDGSVTNIQTVETNQETRGATRKVFPSDEVNYVGEPVAVVLAEDAYSAEDAVELLEVDYEPLDAVIDLEGALKENSAKVHHYLADNIAYHMTHSTGDVEGAFRLADEVVKIDLVNQRVHPVSMEPRGAIASFDEGNGDVTIWLSSQDPNGLRNGLAEILKMPQQKVRVIAPDVGGAFGGKAAPYPEDVALMVAAMRFKRPVKWVESRREHFLTTSHGRGQKQYAEVAVRRDGKILALKTRILSDAGAYSNGDNTDIPFQTFKMGTGVYDIAAYEAEVFSVFTNKCPQGSYRGAGRPEAAYLIERAMDIVARKLKLDPVKIRQTNFIEKNKFPFKTPAGYVYDSGDYEANLAKALQLSDYRRLREEQRLARRDGRLVGVGIAVYTEVSGFRPGRGQTASVTIDPEGKVLVTVGGHSHGQGHAVTMAQIVCDELAIGIELISVRHGDTAMLPWSSVTAGSRTAALSGSAALLSARKLRGKMSEIAAHMLGIQNSRMVFRNNKIYAEDNSSRALDFAEVARAAYNAEKIPRGMEPTLFAYSAFAPPNFTFPFGTHLAMVEVDRETGVVRLLKYFSVDDCGRVINPLIVEGQVHGGVVQGIGQALLEEIIYDEGGQLLTSTLADYAMVSAESLPQIVCDRTETTTDSNLLGVKGIGEAPAIGSTPAVMNAIEDALSQNGMVTVNRMPARPDYIKSLIAS